jgi:phytoene synthase
VSTTPTPPTDAGLAESFALCRRIARQQARNFYYGMKLTPQPKRSALYAIYAWMRAADDLVDSPAPAGADRTVRLDDFHRQTFETPASGPGPESSPSIWPAVHKVLHDYPIPLDCLEAMIAGQELDQHKTRYANFGELHDYCYKVAGSVGLVCLSIWGYGGGQETRDLAIHRGLALQLTNILRDLVEDAKRDRLYLPEDELARCGTDADDLLDRLRRGSADAVFDKVMQFQVERAASFYAQSAALEGRVDPACRPTCWALMRIYRGLFDQIAADPRRVLRERVRLSGFQKLGIALTASWQRRGTQPAANPGVAP